jgi:hypothetical protein
LEEAARKKELIGVFEKILTYEEDAEQGVNKDEVLNYGNFVDLVIVW